MSTNDSNDSRELLKATAEIFSEMVRDNLSKEALLLIYQKCHCQQLPLENARIVKTSDESHANEKLLDNITYLQVARGVVEFRFVSSILPCDTFVHAVLYCCTVLKKR